MQKGLDNIKLHIREVNSASDSEWDSIWSRCDYATYCHSREWSELWEQYSYGSIKPDPVLIQFSDGKRAVLPFSRQEYFGGIVKRYVSSIPNCRPGGWISSDDLTLEHAGLITAFIQRNYSHINWRLNPFDDLVGRVNIPADTFYDAHIIALDRPFDDIYKSFANGQRGAIKQAIKNGVSVRLAETLDDWKGYFITYEDSIERWGKRAVEIKSWEIFKLIFENKSPFIKLWIAEYRDTIISGALCLFSKNIVTPFTISTLEKYYTFRPASLVYYTFIEYGCDNGYKWIDLGISGNNKGLIKFKERYGAKPVQSYMYMHRPPIVRLLRTMPLSFYKYLRNISRT